MVLLHVKRDQKSLFLYETSTKESVHQIINDIAELYNGTLKIRRICDEFEGLAEHGVISKPEIRGLLEDQIRELKLKDEESEERIPSGGSVSNPDPLQKRCGKAPNEEMKKILVRTMAEARQKISPDNVKANMCLNKIIIKECLDIMKGAVTIVYPMGLPDYEPIRMELENREEFDGQSQHSKDVIEYSEACLWFANKEMMREKSLSEYSGKNEKTKLVVKLTTKKSGQPTSESWLTPETQKKLMMENFKRMEELKKLEREEDDSYLDSDWADGHNLKRKFQNLSNITWK